MTEKKKSLLFTGVTLENMNSQQVLSLCKNALASEDTFDHIFFYYDAVNIAKDVSEHSAWRELAKQYDVALIACSTVANRRGITESDDTGPFELAGLSEFYSRLHSCSEVVQL